MIGVTIVQPKYVKAPLWQIHKNKPTRKQFNVMMKSYLYAVIALIIQETYVRDTNNWQRNAFRGIALNIYPVQQFLHDSFQNMLHVVVENLWLNSCKLFVKIYLRLWDVLSINMQWLKFSDILLYTCPKFIKMRKHWSQKVLKGSMQVSKHDKDWTDAMELVYEGKIINDLTIHVYKHCEYYAKKG